jgi:hypothetical protein
MSLNNALHYLRHKNAGLRLRTKIIIFGDINAIFFKYSGQIINILRV